MQQTISRVVEADLLAVGGSGAGVTAAIYAARQGLDAVLVSKGKVGYSGNAIMAGGGFGIDGESGKNLLGLEDADPSFTKEKLFDCIVKESFFLSDQNMVEQYVEEGPTVVRDYIQWAQNAKQDFFFCKPANWISSGLSFTRALVQGLKETPAVRVMEDVIILEILTKYGQVCGALGLDIYSGELILFRAKAVVLGTGGYQPFSRNNTVTDMTGDGPAMAYRAGAKLTDMEFILSFPTAVVPQEMKGSIYPYVFEYNMRNLQYTVRDKNGSPLPIPEEIIKLSRGGKLSKLVASYYFGYAADAGLAGQNDGFFYDYSANSREEKEAGFALFYHRFDRWHKHGYYKGESLDKVEQMIFDDVPLEVGIGAEYCMGGVQVNERMETAVSGLYVAGEASSGVFGACRVGDGLVEMMCQGMRAGLSAADYCRDHQLLEPDEALTSRLLEKILGLFQNKGGRSPISFYQEIEAVCDNGFGVIRTEEKLEDALQKILALQEEWKTLTISATGQAYNPEWLWALQAENLLTCCEAGIRAAILRKESRGCHIRKDYPQVDHDHYLVKFVHSNVGGKMETHQRKPIKTKITPPNGRRNTVIDYFLDPTLNYHR